MNTKNTFFCFLLTSVLFLSTVMMVTAFSAVPEKTPLEASSFTELPKTKIINDFLKKLADSSHYAQVENLGYSDGGRAINALLISTDSEFLADGKPIDGKLSVMLIGSQHGTEPSGSEAIQIIARQLLSGGMDNVIESMNLILVPNANPDGRDNNQRFNENGGNINRDYIELLLSETLLFVDTLYEFQPNVILDVHEASEYKPVLTGKEGYILAAEARFEVGNNPNIDVRLRDFSENVFLPNLIDAVLDEGLSAVRYMGVIRQLDQVVSRGSIRATNFRNYSGLQGVLSVLLENRLDLEDEGYPTKNNIKIRVEKQILSIKQFLCQVQYYQHQIFKLTRQARHKWVFGDQGSKTLILQASFTVNDNKPTKVFDLTELATGKVITHNFANHDKIQASIPFELPDAYVVLAEHDNIADLLQRHHINYQVIDQSAQLQGAYQKINNIDIEPPAAILGQSVQLLTVDLDEEDTLIELRQGDLLIKTDQPLGILIPIIFDPRSSDSIFQNVAYRPLLLKYDEFFILPVTLES